MAKVNKQAGISNFVKKLSLCQSNTKVKKVLLSLEVSSSLSRHKYHSVYSQCFLSWFFETTKNTKLSLFDVCGVLPTKVFKGQLISKCLLGIFNSSKKRTNEFYFTTIKPQIDLFSFLFWRKLKAPKRHFEIN